MSGDFNTTLIGTSSLNTFSSWTFVIGITGVAMIIAMIIGITGLALSSLERYKWFKSLVSKLGVTWLYFKYGTIGYGFIGACAGIYFGLSSEASNGFPIMRWVAFGIIAYLLTALMGVGIKRVIDRAKNYEKVMRDNNKLGRRVKR